MRPGLLLSLLLLASLSLPAQIPRPHHVWYVDGVHGNDNNDCKSKRTACKTISHAISLASPDDAILVGPATYDENLTLNFNLGIIGSDASTTIIDGQRRNSVIFIPNSNTNVVLDGFTLRDGVSQGDGGGVTNGGILAIFDSVITENVAEYGEGESDGAGIYNAGTLTLNRSTVSQNQTKNVYYSYGSGICNFGTMMINETTVSGNSSGTTDTYGAGIFNGGTLTMNRSTVSGNFTNDGASTRGGGIDNIGTAMIYNSTVHGNKSRSGPGGGISNEYTGVATISNSTISDNSSGGISNSAALTIQNSIVAGNAGNNCDGAITSNGYNLSSDSSCNFNGPGDLNDTKPNLGELANNGGPTQTQALPQGSPAIDAGNPNGCTDGQGHLLTTDQRGAPRPDYEDSSGCDMGAFERQSD